jgi:hypothetical protein
MTGRANKGESIANFTRHYGVSRREHTARGEQGNIK